MKKIIAGRMMAQAARRSFIALVLSVAAFSPAAAFGGAQTYRCDDAGAIDRLIADGDIHDMKEFILTCRGDGSSKAYLRLQDALRQAETKQRDRWSAQAEKTPHEETAPSFSGRGAADDLQAALDCISEAWACSRSALVACILAFENRHPDSKEESVQARQAGNQKLKSCVLPDGVYQAKLTYRQPKQPDCRGVIEIQEVTIFGGRISFSSNNIPWDGKIDQFSGDIDITANSPFGVLYVRGNFDKAEVRTFICGEGVFRILK